jgi:hypothetical protein
MRAQTSTNGLWTLRASPFVTISNHDAKSRRGTNVDAEKEAEKSTSLSHQNVYTSLLLLIFFRMYTFLIQNDQLEVNS